MPFLRSPESSRLSSFSDLPDLLFLSSCDGDEKKKKKRKLEAGNEQRNRSARMLAPLIFTGSSHATPEDRGRSRYLLGRGEVGAVRSRGAVLGGGAAGNVVGVWQGPALHLGQHALLVQERLEETCVAVKLHQVIDLRKTEKVNK